MDKRKVSRRVRVDSPGRPFFWFVMLAGMILIAYFSLTMVMNFTYAIDLAGDGVQVVLEEAVIADGQVVEEPEVVVLHGINGWVESFAPWLAVNAFTLFLGVFLFGLGYTMTGRKEEGVAVAMFKMRILGGYLAVLSLLMLVLGVDRVFFIPHGPRATFLSWFDWYVMEFLAHLIWAVLLMVFAVFFMRVDRMPGDGEETAAAAR